LKIIRLDMLRYGVWILMFFLIKTH
jgi:hypothetical protein